MRQRGRSRKYQGNIRCPECGSNRCKKFGKNTGKQRYKCNECEKPFYKGAKYHKHTEKVKLIALKMYSEGMSKSVIAQVLNLPYGTVSRWTYEAGRFLDKYLEKKWKKLANRIDVDEISIYEMSIEGNPVWIWTACIKKRDKKYYVYEVGNRNGKTFLKSTG